MKTHTAAADCDWIVRPLDSGRALRGKQGRVLVPRKAFTLIEVLVVVSIIALLASILLPSLSKARNQAKRVVCAAQMHQVGVAFLSYLHDSRDHMPLASDMPSIGPAPLDLDTPPITTPVYFSDVLKPHLKGQIQAMECPADTPGLTDRGVPNQGLSYFQSERSSYGYRTSLRGLAPQEFNQRHHVMPGWNNHPMHTHALVAPATIWVACDYWNFHGTEGTNGARRYLYIDGHVADYEN